MSEKKTVVDVVMVNLHCDKCNQRMEILPEVLTSNPPIYQYKCPNCGNKQNSQKSYPYTEYQTKTGW